jgi:hypothetical protein
MSDNILRLRPQVKELVASQTATATGNSGNLNDTTGSLPMFPAMITLMFVTTANSGSSETLDLTLEMSYDGGTTYVVHSAFTQQTAAVEHVAVFRNYVGAGDAAHEAVESAAGTFLNGPYGPDHRFVWTIGGSSPSFTFAIHAIITPAFV